MNFSGGHPETNCGGGSTLAATQRVREWLPGVLRGLEIKSLLDAPCGDMNWIAHTNLSMLDEYRGVDYHAPHIEKASERLATMPNDLVPAKFLNVRQLDILQDEWPKADAVLCRDFLQHWLWSYFPAFLERFHASGARYLICTSFNVDINTDIPEPSGFAPLNVRLAPLNWPEPLDFVDDGPGRILGVWSRAGL